jgi:hypothetical protein
VSAFARCCLISLVRIANAALLVVLCCSDRCQGHRDPRVALPWWVVLVL